MSRKRAPAGVLVVDVGGTNIKVRATGQAEARQFPSGPKLTPEAMVAGVRSCAPYWRYDVVSIGYPGIVVRDRPVTEPHNLGRGWVGFDYAGAFGCPVRIINDAAMQALGSYRGGKLLFLGLGTGFGSAMIVDGVIEPMELGHAAYRKADFEHYVGAAALARLGGKKWRAEVAKVVAALAGALLPDDIVIGGGNVRLLTELPPGCRAGDNVNDAFTGGLRLWDDNAARRRSVSPRRAKTTRR
jgi:predicted NBD/HSP70 family sugar kinase